MSNLMGSLVMTRISPSKACAAGALSKVSMTATPSSPTTKPALAPDSPLALSMAAYIPWPRFFRAKGRAEFAAGAGVCARREAMAAQQRNVKVRIRMAEYRNAGKLLLTTRFEVIKAMDSAGSRERLGALQRLRDFQHV